MSTIPYEVANESVGQEKKESGHTQREGERASVAYMHIAHHTCVKHNNVNYNQLNSSTVAIVFMFVQWIFVHTGCA